MNLAQTLSTTLANIGSVLGSDYKKNKTLIKKVIDLQGYQTFIAGGGIWPEPYAIDKNKERNSYFFGRNKQGELEFYNDYNDPKGEGYHHEEWYVPAKYFEDGKVYWSKSYVDPYSHEPMVTVTTPIYKDAKFIGVSTVDIMLSGLKRFIEDNVKEFNGYGFILDRNNKFLSFPKSEMSKVNNNYITFNELSKSYQSYIGLNTHLNNHKDELSLEYKNIVKELVRESKQINIDDGENIARLIKDSKLDSTTTTTTDISVHKIDYDPVLHKEVIAITLYQLNTHWNLVVVVPSEVILSQSNRIFTQILLVVFFVTLLGAIISYYMIKNSIVRPIDLMIDELEDKTKTNTLLDDYRDDEFGLLAYWFNEKTKELLDAKVEAEKATEAKSEFLANMSHEIRTPMNGILGFLEQLTKTETDSDKKKKLNIVKNSGNQLINIINDILDFSKIESGKMDIDHHPCNINEMFDNSFNIFSEVASKKNINLNYDIDKNIPKCILADLTRLQQVGFNLISNAIKFTPIGGEVKLIAKFYNNTIYIAIEDTGIGISDEKLEYIFEAFTQEDRSTTRKYGGTGLGLAISSNLLKLMNSELKVESILGKGSKFYFELPVDLCDQVLEESYDKKDSNEDMTFNGHVLVVEDNKTNQILMSLILDEMQVTYDIANDGVGAIENYKNNKYDIILMDENMPNMNGIEATKHIREIELNESLDKTPIIAVTANALTGDREKFLNAGMDDYITKPYTEGDISKILKKYLQ